MTDLQNPKLMWLKGVLFVGIATFSGALLWMETPNFKTLVLLMLTVWGFCRAYYFAFYVLEKYVDPEFRFSGLGSLVVYVVRGRRGRRKP